MTIREAIEGRRSIRRYKSGAVVPRKDIESMLGAAMLAPSACNTRPWLFTVVTNPDVRKKLVDVSPYAKHALTASLAIVVCGLPQAQEGVCGGFWPQDCGAAIENLLLQAYALGYGTCWCGLYPDARRSDAVKQLIGTEGTPLAIITVGAADESPAPRGRFEPSKVTYID